MTQNDRCPSLGFVNNPPNGYVRRLKVCDPRQKVITLEPIEGDGTSQGPVTFIDGDTSGDTFIWNGTTWIVHPQRLFIQRRPFDVAASVIFESDQDTIQIPQTLTLTTDLDQAVLFFTCHIVTQFGVQPDSGFHVQWAFFINGTPLPNALYVQDAVANAFGNTSALRRTVSFHIGSGALSAGDVIAVGATLDDNASNAPWTNGVLSYEGNPHFNVENGHITVIGERALS